MADEITALGVPDDAGSGGYDASSDDAIWADLDKETAGKVTPVSGETKVSESKPKEDDESDDDALDRMFREERGEKVKEKDEEEDEDVDEQDEDEDEETDEDEDEEKDEKKVKEEKEEEPDEDSTLHNRPTHAALKKKYPEIFKEFPGLRAVLFREPEYARVFPTVKEARETAEYADGMREVERLIADGSPDEMLKSIHEASPAILDKFVQNIPAALHKLSTDAYVKMTTPIVKNAILLARMEAKNARNQDLWNGLDHLEKYLFGDPRFTLKKDQAPPDPIKDEREKFEREKQEHYANLAREFEGRVKNRSESMLKKEIGRGLDPQNALTPRMREMLMEQVLDEVTGRMSKDHAHVAGMNRLWRNAQQARLSPAAEEQLIRAWLSRARPLVGPVRRKLLADVLSRGENKEKKGGRPPRVGATGRERSASRTGTVPTDPRRIDYSKTSDADIFEGRAAVKR